MASTLSSGLFTLKEFYNRGVIKLAPDVLVYIGGSLTTSVIAPVSGKDDTVSFNDGITSVNVQNNIDPPGTSTATIEITTPIYGEKSKYWTYFKGIDSNSPVRAPLFVPMMEVKIYYKGRFMVNGSPKYYPAFWGFITNVEENYSGGVYKINLTCADTLHWWGYSTINIHPISEANIMSGGNLILTAFSTIFRRLNPYQILYKLTTDMGMHQFVTSAWAGQKTPLNSIYPTGLFRKVTQGIMAYWQQRFANMGSLLKMYGINGKRVDRNGVQERQPEIYVPKKPGNSLQQKATEPQDKSLFSLDRNYIRQFEIFVDYDDMGGWDNSEYMTKLQIATEVKTKTDFEFYQDVDGNFIFKPPFYNLNVKGVLPYTLLPSDIINYTHSTDTEGLITVMTVNTPLDKNLRTTTYALGKGFHMDIDLAKRFGIRHQEMTMEYINNQALARTLALGEMNKINSKATTGSVTIPGRPEIRLGYPVYIEHRDSFHYVRAINHAFEYGGTFTTTLSLETERVKIYDPDDNWEPYLDKVYSYTGKAAPKDPKKDPNVDTPPTIAVTQDVEKKQQDLMVGERVLHSMQQGKYALVDRQGDSQLSATSTTVPYTDEFGYRVVGSFPYGRALNPVSVVTNTDDLPYLKETYLTTMARPVHEYESESMNILFFDDKDGAVPNYLNLENRQLPRILGAFKDTDLDNEYDLESTVQTESQRRRNKGDDSKKELTNDKIIDITSARPPKSDVPPGESKKILSDLRDDSVPEARTLSGIGGF